ncbi:flagellar protein FliS [Arthrobacter sp. V4I6]|uniref:flagellar export chaperone FliS n=1 Tax=unclassified Arthrobacter TaxID=235627 RepID=UPI002780D3F9|nr:MULTISPECIES: flagellar export chaperone FliS [unclassified Arthrobacter]MDQ0822696.1 flagellar protein FliS [Arthrobacter sp. V1I7]MDQ0852324.1 flagellar protein FliS [Arthrobacter sp. V4I6]
MTTTYGNGYGTAAQRNQYLADSVLSAPPARLLTMLYDRLLLDLGRAESAQQAANWPVASENLLHGQAIIAELISSLKTDAWDGADGLLGVYNYAFTALVNANIQRDPVLTREAIELLEPLRQAWHEAAAAVPAPPAAPASAGYGTTATFPAAASTGFPPAGAWNNQPGTGGGSLGFG